MRRRGEHRQRRKEPKDRGDEIDGRCVGDEIEEKKKMEEKYGGKYGGKIWQKTSCHVDLEGGGFCHIPPPYFFSPYFG
jgi:hypothetical protein